jgi:VIT1/CCC1 family predicted Fe2+/Mn2+ transporter
MHRVIEEERWEIEHHRPQEKEELRALYSAKGFTGRLLDEAVDILMADDNRLLQVMLQEELGFKMETEEHPLKQALGAALGVIASSAVMAFALFALPPFGTLIAAALLIGITAGFAAKLERNRITPFIVWNLACAALAIGAAEFFSQLFFAQ